MDSISISSKGLERTVEKSGKRSHHEGEHAEGRKKKKGQTQPPQKDSVSISQQALQAAKTRENIS